MDTLTDAKAVQLAQLLRLYYDDCAAEDSCADGPSAMTVADLLHDLELSTSETDAERITAQVVAIEELGLYEARSAGSGPVAA
jgi:hypothetical protein